MDDAMQVDLLLARIRPVSSWSACWIWTGTPNGNGYGTFGGHGRGYSSRRAHRRAYELAVGPVTPGLQLDHRCGRRLCVNPLHLEEVTQTENIRRIDRSVCKRGHEMIEGNIILKVMPDGRQARQCRTCDLAGKEARRRARGAVKRNLPASSAATYPYAP
jgi:hypothetical protein